MKNTLVDLNNHLFEQMERLNDEELTSDQLELEIKRAKAMTAIATNIIDNGTLALNSQKYIDEEYGVRRNGPVPEGHCLIFLDGDRSHIELDNLMLISRKTLAVLNKRKLIRKDADLTRTGVRIAELIRTIGQQNRNDE